MAVLVFKDFSFEDKGDVVRFHFLRIFYFDVDKSSLEKIGKFQITTHAIEFPDISDKKAHNKFNSILLKGFSNLRNKISKNRTIYVHKNSGIPLFGVLNFGIVDKGSSMIEIKPLSSCNINCVFCSVDEGVDSTRKIDYIVEKDYIVQELKKLVEYKQAEDLVVYINPQGEPTLYADLVPLVKGIREIKGVKIVTIITNGALLNKPLLDELVDAGLNRINVSINAIDEKIAAKMAGMKSFNINHVKKMVTYLSNKIEVILSPVFTPGFNDDQIEKRYCPYCKKHTDHKVSQNKKKTPSSLKYGSKVRAKKRGAARGKGNLGRYSKPAITKFKMTGKKTSKKTDLRYLCTTCKKSHMQSSGIRARRVELV